MTTAAPTRVLRLVTVVLGIVLSLVAGAASGVPGDPDPVGGWPLRPVPEVVGTFDPPATPYGAGHRGVDLAGREGQTVRSALPGTVTYAGSLAGRGVVVVGHGATRTTYEPVTSAVSVGDPVATGTPLGSLQLSGSHCFPRACLHWGWIEGETYLDPLRLVGAGPVRLLPLWSAPVPSPEAGHRVSAARLPLRLPLAYAGWQPLLQLLHLRSTG
ncbi:MAG: peptidoglycan DD-metalloendopeptidase family protein [Nocardioides sp.]|nr:peptidoglycan DD-metalloendopeptidase family protein [Nocardioides sp.]